MKCDKRQMCNVCDGTFEMTRGCNLEKRCLACRFLHLQKTDKNREYLIGKNTYTQKENTHNLVLHDESFIISAYVDRNDDLFSFKEEPNYEYLNTEEIEFLINVTSEHFNEREIKILRMRFGLTSDRSVSSLEEIAKEFNVTTERVHQIESSIIKSLKHPKIGRILRQCVYNVGRAKVIRSIVDNPIEEKRKFLAWERAKGEVVAKREEIRSQKLRKGYQKEFKELIRLAILKNEEEKYRLLSDSEKLAETHLALEEFGAKMKIKNAKQLEKNRLKREAQIKRQAKALSER